MSQQPPKPANNYSYSQIATWLRCPFKWFVAFGLGITPMVVSPKPHLGTMVHAGLHAAITCKDDHTRQAIKRAIIDIVVEYTDKHQISLDTGNDELIDIYAIERQEVEERGKKAIDICYRAFDKFISEFEPMEKDGVILSEYRFTAPDVLNDPNNPINITGTIDCIAKERATGHVWLIDFKVRGQFANEFDEEVNVQFATYQYFLMQQGIPVIGTMQYQIYNELPKIPPLLQSGKALSRADIRTDWHTYKATVLNHGFDPADYKEMEAKLASKEFYRILKDYRNSDTVTNYFNTIMVPALTAIVNKPDPIRAMSSWNCLGCDVRRLCLAGLRGDDVDYIIESEFVHNDYADKYKELESDEE